MGRKKSNFGKAKRSKKLVGGKSGKWKYNDNINDLKNRINAREDLTADQKKTLIETLDAEVDKAKKDNRTLTENGFLSRHIQITEEERRALTREELQIRTEENKKLKAFSNAGVDVDELAGDLGVNRGELLNPANWSTDDKGTTRITINGESYIFEFTYTGSVLKREN